MQIERLQPVPRGSFDNGLAAMLVNNDKIADEKPPTWQE